MVEHSAEYQWSSYRANAQGEHSVLLTQHPLYTALGKDDEVRLTAYREFFRYQLDPEVIDEIRTATNGNYALGSAKFKAKIAVTPGKSGRPRKMKDPKSQELFGED